ncbi:MAG TPA: ABC transporter permease subunit [Candidatus Glassbacteria bacterium]|nr:ABC transporter permease subunit [Candidatus Glassbacteria bacterium]
MRNVLAIFWREYKSYFVSPIAYVVIGVFIILVANRFIYKFNEFVQYTFEATSEAVTYQTTIPKFSINDEVVRYLFQNMRNISLFLLPMITMRLFAEERKTGTLELLLTSPLTITQLVLGKFLSAFFLFVTMLLPTAACYYYLFAYGNPDLGPIITSFVGMLFYGAAVISVGTLISSLTENQIIAGALTFGAFLFLWIVGRVGESTITIWGQIANYISINAHFNNFAMGVVDTRDVFFYLSFSFIGLFFTHQAITSLRWR